MSCALVTFKDLSVQWDTASEQNSVEIKYYGLSIDRSWEASSYSASFSQTDLATCLLLCTIQSIGGLHSLAPPLSAPLHIANQTVPWLSEVSSFSMKSSSRAFIGVWKNLPVEVWVCSFSAFCKGCKIVLVALRLQDWLLVSFAGSGGCCYCSCYACILNVLLSSAWLFFN